MARSYNFFISDLHLDKEQPQLNDLFNQYCQELITWTKQKMDQQHITDLADSKDSFRVRLFILGDFLAKALGDEVEPWFKSQQEQLLALTALGIETYFSCGNRDFLLDINFCDKVGMLCVEENEIIEFMQNDLELNWRLGKSYLTKKDLPNFKEAHLTEILSVNEQNKLQATVEPRSDVNQVYVTSQALKTQAEPNLNQINDQHLKDQALNYAVNTDEHAKLASEHNHTSIDDNTSNTSNNSNTDSTNAANANTTNSNANITTPISLNLHQTDPVALSLLLCHGDNLCLSDRGYLKFRHYIRSSFIRFIAGHTPYWFKNFIGNYLRKKSYQSQQLQQKTTANNTNQSSNLSSNKSAKVKVTCIDVPYSFNLLSANNVNLSIFGHVHKQIVMVRNNNLGFLEQQFNLAVSLFKQQLTPKEQPTTTSSKKTFKQRVKALEDSGYESKIEKKFNEFSKGFYDPDACSNQPLALKHHKLADYTYADFSYESEFLEQLEQNLYFNPKLQKVVALPLITNFNEICGEQGIGNSQIGYKLLEQAKAIHLNFKPLTTKQGVFWQIGNASILQSRILSQAGSSGFIPSSRLRQQQTLISMADWQASSPDQNLISSVVLIHQLPENNADTNDQSSSTSLNQALATEQQASFCLEIMNDLAGFQRLP